MKFNTLEFRVILVVTSEYEQSYMRLFSSRKNKDFLPLKRRNIHIISWIYSTHAELLILISKYFNAFKNNKLLTISLNSRILNIDSFIHIFVSVWRWAINFDPSCLPFFAINVSARRYDLHDRACCEVEASMTFFCLSVLNIGKKL